MTLNATVRQNLAEWQPAAGRQATLMTDHDSLWSANLVADSNERLSCLAWEVTLSRKPKAERPEGQPRAWAEKAAADVRGLPEALSIYEIDDTDRVAVLRTAVSVDSGNDSFFHEIRLTDDFLAELRCFRVSEKADRKRDQTPFPITHESLARVLDDLATAAE